MLYPVYVYIGEGNVTHGAVIPDFPGCFSAAIRWDDLPSQVQDALELYCEDGDIPLPKPSSLDALVKNPDYQEGAWLMVDVDVSRLRGPARRVNVTIPEAALKTIDKAAGEGGESRSAFLTRAGLRLAREQKPDKVGAPTPNVEGSVK